jgi:hypothetical protein
LESGRFLVIKTDRAPNALPTEDDATVEAHYALGIAREPDEVRV